MEKFTLQDFEDELKQSVNTEMEYEFRMPPQSAEAFGLEGLCKKQVKQSEELGAEAFGLEGLRRQQVKRLEELGAEAFDLEGLRRQQVKRLEELGVIATDGSMNRLENVGKSDYSQHLIQPYSIWLEYELNPWDADIVKRVLRTKSGDPRALDYEKIIHICEERLRQLKC